jgi:hypothetical protein
MKKTLIILVLAAFLLGGCSAAWYEHDTIYKNNDHMWYSIFGYKNTDHNDMNLSQFEDWWGEEIPYDGVDSEK